MPIQDSELIQSFLTESMEMLDDAEPKLIDLQRVADSTGAVDNEMVNSIFRAFHSIKGSAGFLQMKNISAVTHEAETLLDRFRKGKTHPTSESTNILFRACDVIRKLLGAVEETQSDEGCGPEVEEAVGELSRIILREKESDAAPSTPSPAAPAPAPTPAPAPAPSHTHPPAPAATSMTDAQKANMLIDEEEPVRQEEAPPIPVRSSAATVAASSDMIAVFVQDAEDLIENIEQSLLKIEKSPKDAKELIREALRALHTLKGNSGLMGMEDIGRLGHKMETVWQLVCDGAMPSSTDIVKLSLKIMDVFRKTVTSVSQGGNGKILAFAGFSDLLDEMIPTDRQADSKPPPTAAPPPASTAPAASAPKPAPEKTEEKAPARGESEPGAVPLVSRSIRVNIDKLDQLNNLVGELVIAEAMVTHNSDLQELRLDNFDRCAHQLRLITSEIQDISMSLRMIPVDATLKKMVRLVHDLSAKASKKVDLQLAGTETEVDRTVAELISDPLVHMVRNSIDHGLETPDERRKAGKSEVGVLHIEAKHKSGEVLIIISDDGRGLNRDKILKKGIERGLINPGVTYRDEEIYNLIFEAGFSTADKITDVSGRGVGMDVVRKNIEKIRGRVEIQTEAGIGTTFTIHIPLTLAIIHGMLVQVGHERYIIPLLAIRESFQPETTTLNTVVGRGEMISIRGELLPLFRLSRLFNSRGAIEQAEKGIAVVVEDGVSRAALLVDRLLGQQQTVVKSLGDTFGQMDGISGASILSDGRVGLILDIGGVIKIATAADRASRTR
jgi:two-component system, chemotaxis family, sensor kinase CheA